MITENLQAMSDALQAILWEEYLTNPIFYLQLVLFALLVSIAWLAAQRLRQTNWAEMKPTWLPDPTLFYFPVITLLLGWLISGAFRSSEYPLPIFDQLYTLFWIVLLYRFALICVQWTRPHHTLLVQKRILLPLARLLTILLLIGQMDRFFQIINRPLVTIYDGTPQQIAITLPLLVLGPFAAFVIYATSQGLRTLLSDDILPNLGWSTSQSYAMATFVSYTIIIMGTLMTLAGLGVNTSNLTVVGSALALGMGFGLQHTVDNLVSGFLIMFDSLISVGDLVEVEGEQGVIRHIGIRNSMIEIWDGTQVVIPNSTLVNTPMLNLNHSERYARVTVSVPIIVGADPHKVYQSLLSILDNQPDIMDKPPPSVTLAQFEERVMLFEVRFRTTSPHHVRPMKTVINLAIWDEMQRLGYELAPPREA